MSDVNNNSTHVSALDMELVSTRFDEALRIVTSSAERLLENQDFETERSKSVLLLLELFLVLCNKLIVGKEISIHEEKEVRQARRLATLYLNQISFLSRAYKRNDWIHAPLPKVPDKKLALDLVKSGYADKVEDVYVELKGGRAVALEQAAENWRSNKRERAPRRGWIHAPLFGFEIVKTGK